ncbi:hypothetical protein OWM54_12250 [Myxococcus sp. MISCRS1]|uniref:hypothetical protein n=1 Tax=Myxococcus sp. MISCRS1 TaxID=2996786 RepID=UPI0022706530|nr:hypothetical protein [Myxococcus sp. MISCRS1]MCY0997908.1 hypothetical protein [Myxococcus sp. MISCRS1]
MSRNESRAWVHRWVLAGLLLGTLGCAGRKVRAGDRADAADQGPVQHYFCPVLKAYGELAVEVDELGDSRGCVDPGGTITFDSKRQAVTYVLFAGEKTLDHSQPQPTCFTRADECQQELGIIGTITLAKGQSCQLTLSRGVSSGQITAVGNTSDPARAPQGNAVTRIPPMDVIIGKLEVATSTTGEEDARAPR